jgi:hypothetical protein
MRGFKSWVLALTIALAIMASADAKPVAPDASAAEAAIAEAQTAVRQAEGQRALWTGAEDALRKARRALQEGDAAMAVEQARIAQQLSELGIAQKNYPPFR